LSTVVSTPPPALGTNDGYRHRRPSADGAIPLVLEIDCEHERLAALPPKESAHLAERSERKLTIISYDHNDPGREGIGAASRVRLNQIRAAGAQASR
jgi:hypothetical protein